jgi:hypothetical protein
VTHGRDKSGPNGGRDKSGPYTINEYYVLKSA